MGHKAFPARLAFVLDNPIRQLITPVDGRLRDLGIAPGMKVLDMGVGPGFLLPSLLEIVGAEGHVYAFDRQVEMIDRAMTKVSPSAPVTFRVRVAPTTELEDHCLDVVLFHQVFHEVDDRSGMIRECRRILKTGGLVSIWEPRFAVREWKLRSYEGMFRGKGFKLEKSWATVLGFGRRFRLTDEAIGSRLHSSE